MNVCKWGFYLWAALWLRICVWLTARVTFASSCFPVTHAKPDIRSPLYYRINCFSFSTCPLTLVPLPFGVMYLQTQRDKFLSSQLPTCKHPQVLYSQKWAVSVSLFYHTPLATTLVIMDQNWSSSSDPNRVLLQGITLTTGWPSVDIWSLSFTWEPLQMQSPLLGLQVATGSHSCNIPSKSQRDTAI